MLHAFLKADASSDVTNVIGDLSVIITSSLRKYEVEVIFVIKKITKMNLVICYLIVVLFAADMALSDVKISKIKLWGDSPSVEVTLTRNDTLVSPVLIVYNNYTSSNIYRTFNKTQNKLYVFDNITAVPDLKKQGGLIIYNNTVKPLFETGVVYLFNNTDFLFNNTDVDLENMAYNLDANVSMFRSVPGDDQFLYLCDDGYRLTNQTNCHNETLSVTLKPTSTTVSPSDRTNTILTSTEQLTTQHSATLQANTTIPVTESSTSVTSSTNATSPSTSPASVTAASTNAVTATTLPTHTNSTTAASTNAVTATTLPTHSNSTTAASTSAVNATTLPSSTNSTSAASTNATSTLPSNVSSTETLPTSASTIQQNSTSPKPSITSTQPPPKMMINEVNLLLTKKDFFVELRGLSSAVQTVSVVVFDAEVGTCLTHVRLNETTSPDISGFAVLPITEVVVKTRNAFVIALFDTSDWLRPTVGCPTTMNMTGLKDVLIISKHMDIVSEQVVGTFARDTPTRLMVVDPDQIAGSGQNYSISRCAPQVMDSSAFILSHPSWHRENECKTGFGNKIQLKLTDARCKDFQTSQAKQQLVDALVYTLANYCSCGISPLLFKLQKFQCGSLIFESFLEAIDHTLADKMFIYYNALIESTPSLTIGNKTYQVDTKCNNDCLTTPGEKQGNIKQTIAVVVSCLLVFIIVVIVVIIYLKKKRRGVLQFRMTRLDEDDDDLMNPDMDDFVGSQVASFENKLYTRFSRK